VIPAVAVNIGPDAVVVSSATPLTVASSAVAGGGGVRGPQPCRFRVGVGEAAVALSPPSARLRRCLPSSPSGPAPDVGAVDAALGAMRRAIALSVGAAFAAEARGRSLAGLAAELPRKLGQRARVFLRPFSRAAYHGVLPRAARGSPH
jgi:hypothetical protein